MIDFTKATETQLRVIIEEDRGIAPSLLLQALEEAVRRDTYHKLIMNTITRFFGSLFVAEKMTDTSLEDLKQMCYIEIYPAWKLHKPGENSFISFWIRFMRTKLKDVARDAKTEKREINRMKDSIDDESENYIQIKDDFDTEHQAINNVYLDYLFTFLNPKERQVMQLVRKGYRIVDAAEILGESRQCIDRRFRLGKQKILEGIGA